VVPPYFVCSNVRKPSFAYGPCRPIGYCC